MKAKLVPLSLLALGLSACPSNSGGGNDDMAMAPVDMAPGPMLTRASKSSTVAISEDDAVVVMSAPFANLIVTYNGQTGAKLGQVSTGKEPFAVVMHPDNKTAFVSNRGDATVVKVTNLASGDPSVSAAVPVGSEPTGLALSPSGGKLFVAEWAESRVSVIDTATMKVIGTIPGVRSPRALLVTNDKDGSDDNETLVVPEFFGEPVPGKEGKDDGRRGIVRLFSVKDYSAKGTITFNPLTPAEADFTGGMAANPVGTAPNQLFAVALRGQQIFVPSVSASPQGPPKFDNNVNPVVYVGDLSATKEIKTSTTGTVNLAREVNKPEVTNKLFLADLRDVDFVPGSGVAYFVSQGADVVQRVVFGADASLTEFGSTQNKQIDLNVMADPCQGPNGIVVANKSQRAFVNCWSNQRLGVLDLAGQKLEKTVEAGAIGDAQVQRGRRFFFTGRGRWSNSAWSSCGSCHPDGLTDNITWLFAAGPRQTTSMDGSYSHGGGAQKQRVFNWTAIIDEMHDFEGNTRGTQGGKGAITTAAAQADCGDLTKETPAVLAANNLATPTAKEVQDAAGMVRCVKDFDDIDAYAKTIRPPRGRRGLDAASVERGRALFAEGKGGCVRCHGGAGWTVSRRFYTPSTAVNTKLTATTAFSKPAAWPASYTFQSTFQIAAQPISAELAGFNAAPIAPPQVACAIRNVGTFGVPGDVAATDALEVKPTAPATRAQGRGGFNPPALYGLQLGAPYLHHGQAATLEALFTDAGWKAHFQAGGANFLEGDTAARDRADLINFLLSIDATTAEQAVPAGFADGCTE